MGLSFHSAMARCSFRSPGSISVPTEYLDGLIVWEAMHVSRQQAGEGRCAPGRSIDQSHKA